MEKATLEAQIRTIRGKACKNLRTQGFIPAIVYGRGMESISIQVPAKPFIKVIGGDAGTNVIINLMITNGKQDDVAVITHGVERDPLTDGILHIDFHHIIMTEKIKTQVRIEVIGSEPEGVKEEGGVLVQGLREIEVECLPADIPEKFEVDASNLKINESLHVSNLVVPPGIVLLHENLEDMVVMVSPPTKEEEIVPAVMPEGSLPLEGEVGAEGAAPAEGAIPAEGAVPAKGEGAAPAKGDAKGAAPAKGDAKAKGDKPPKEKK